MEQMEAALRDAQQKIQKIEPLANCANQMINQGFLKEEENGMVTLIENEKEREQLRQSKVKQHAQQGQIQAPEQIKPGRPRRKAAEIAIDQS